MTDSPTPTSDTLVIYHFPKEFNDEDKQDFFRFFGAIQVKILKSKTKDYNVIFARFPNKFHAAAVLHKIHQSKLCSQRLTVEFSKTEDSVYCLSEEKSAFNNGRNATLESKKMKLNSKSVDLFLNSMNNWLSDVNYKAPPPCHLRYQYPPPSPYVLQNISKALAVVPKFYTQVLHLMNKMNLPSPFEQSFPICCDNLFTIHEPKNDVLFSDFNKGNNYNTKDNYRETESEESELETDDEAPAKSSDIIPKIKLIRKKPRKLDITKAIKSKRKGQTAPSCSTKKFKAEQVFDKTNIGQSNKIIQVKLVTPDVNLLCKTGPLKSDQESGFNILNRSNQSAEPEEDLKKKENEESNESMCCISEQELAANRLSEKDHQILPVFKNYAPGAPSCRLYIKNLAKIVTVRDLHYIYRRYFLKYYEEQGTMFDVRLMQEGRMKGQAFITLQTLEMAQKALEETNGFILKDKPMVVQFARSSSSK